MDNFTKRPKNRKTRFFVIPDVSATGIKSATLRLGTAHDKALSLKLDQTSSSASGLSTSINRKDYIIDLNSIVLKSEAEIGGIKRARMLFDPLAQSNPKYAPGWVAAARVEEHAGRIRFTWAVEFIPRSVEMWLALSQLDT